MKAYRVILGCEHSTAECIVLACNQADAERKAANTCKSINGGQYQVAHAELLPGRGTVYTRFTTRRVP